MLVLKWLNIAVKYIYYILVASKALDTQSIASYGSTTALVPY